MATRTRRSHGRGGAGRRSMWTGAISFGLVNVPVQLFPAVRPARLALRMLAPDGTPLARRYVCPEHGTEVPWDDLVRGYPTGEETYVTVTEEELERLAPEKSRTIDLSRFVPRDQLDPFLFDRPYLLVPGEGGAQGYQLLARAMADAGRVGIATFVMRDQEYLVALLTDHGYLRLETLRFADEVRTPEAVDLPEERKSAKKDVDRFVRAIQKRAAQQLDPAELEDERTQQALALVKKKQAAGQVVETAAADDEEERPVLDLMAAIRASLEQAGGSPPATKGGKKPPLADYDELSAAEVSKRLADLTPAELRRLGEFETRHKNRKTVRQAIEKQLARAG